MFRQATMNACSHIRTQMTLVLIGKDLVLEGSTPKIEDKQVPGIYYVPGDSHRDPKFIQTILGSHQPRHRLEEQWISKTHSPSPKINGVSWFP